MANIIDETGFKIDSYNQNRENIINVYQESYGSNIKTIQTSIFGTLISGNAFQLTEALQFFQQIMSNISPLSALGKNLDNVGALMYTFRDGATKSTVSIDITADSGGCSLTAGDSYDDTWQVLANTLINPNDTVSVSFEAVENGEIVAAANTLTDVSKIPVAGIDSMTNPLAAVVGRLRATDSQYRNEILDSSARPSPTKLGCTKGLNQIDSVIIARVIYSEKTGDEGQLLGMPLHTCLPVCEGGEDNAVAQFLVEKGVGGGIPMIDDPSIFASPQPTIKTIEVIDPITDDIYDASWAVALDTEIEIEVTYKVLLTVGDVSNQIKNQLVNFWQPAESKLGASVNPQTIYKYLINDLFEVIEIVQIRVKRKASGTFQTTILDLLAWEKFKISDADITTIEQP